MGHLNTPLPHPEKKKQKTSMLDGTRDQMNLTNIFGTFYLNPTDYIVKSSQQLRELIQNALFSRTQNES